MRNQEMPQTGDSRPVMPPSQHALSKQVMKNWDFWEKKITNATNKRILEQWALRQCPCNTFQIDCFGDHLQTCQVKSAAT
jgi:hypothetical protein